MAFDMMEHDAALNGAIGPIENANGLPNEAYVDTAWFREETKRLFFDGWMAIGFAHDVAEPGAMAPVTFLGVPLLMVRDRDNELRVFQNVCRHRGMILVDEPKSATMVRCPYHAWTYGLDGTIRAAPHFNGPGTKADVERDLKDCNLFQVRAETLLGVVFVNLSGNAPDFATWSAPLRTRWAEFTDRPLTFAGADSHFELDVNTNWKLAVENYCESYHLPFVHPSLNSYSRLEDHYNIIETGFSGQGTTVYNPQLSSDGKRFPDFTDLSDKWDAGAEYVALYPNVLFGVHRDHTFAILLEPLSTGQTREHVRIFYTDEAVTGDDWSDLRAHNTAMWRVVFEEDLDVVHGMQMGRAAPAFDGGRFSPTMDPATHAFHAWAADRMLQP